MFTLPIFVYSKKTSDAVHVDSLKITADIPEGYNWDDETINSVSNPYYVDEKNGVEIVTEGNKQYIKPKDYYLSEKFSTFENLSTEAIESGYKKALWSNSVSEVTEDFDAVGTVGRIECAYEIETVPIAATSPSLTNANSFQFLKTTPSKTPNVFVTYEEFPANKVILGVSLDETETIKIGNSITGTSYFNNNKEFFPFLNNLSGKVSLQYGANNNQVPQNSLIKKITFYSNSTAQYTLPGKLVLVFDLYNGATLIESAKEVELLSQTNTLLNNINTTLTLDIPINSKNLIFKNVQLKNVVSSTASMATALFNLLNLEMSASFINLNNTLLTTKPEITSEPFLLKTESGTEFTGFGSLKLYDVNSSSGLEVYARFSESLFGIQSSEYVLLGTVSGSGTNNNFKLFLDFSSQNPVIANALNAKYVQIKLSAVKSTSLDYYDKSSLSRLIVLDQNDFRKKSFVYNSFPEKIKFEKAKESITTDNNLFGPFYLNTNKEEKNYSDTTNAIYENAIGVINAEHVKHEKITFYAKNALNNDLLAQPTYTPSSEAEAYFIGHSASGGNSKHLVLTYDLKVEQSGQSYYLEYVATGKFQYKYLNSRNAPYYDNAGKALEVVSNSFCSESLDSISYSYRCYKETLYTQQQRSYINLPVTPVETKKLYVTAKKSGFNNLPLPDQKSKKRNLAEFNIIKSSTFVDNCIACTGGQDAVCTELATSTKSGKCVREETYTCYSISSNCIPINEYYNPPQATTTQKPGTPITTSTSTTSTTSDRSCSLDEYGNCVGVGGECTKDEYGVCWGVVRPQNTFSSFASSNITNQYYNPIAPAPPGCVEASACNDCSNCPPGYILVNYSCPSTSPCTRCAEWETVNGTVVTCSNGTPCTCTGRTYHINNSTLKYAISNVREVIVEFTPAAGSSPEIIKEVKSFPYNVKNTQELVGLWVGTLTNTNSTKYIEPVFSVTETPITFVPEKITIPPIKFDQFSINDTQIAKSFEVRLKIDFLNSQKNIVGDSLEQIINQTSTLETVINAPTNISGASIIRTSIGIIPKNLPVYNVGVSNSENYTMLSVPPQAYSVPNFDYLTDVGIEISSKPRIEYTDTSITAGQRKLYVKSQAISKAYNLFTAAGVPEYTINSTDYPVIKSDVLLDGTTSIPEGTFFKIEWQASDNGLTGWTAWKSSPLDSAIVKKFVRFRITMHPSVHPLYKQDPVTYSYLAGKGYRTPSLDEIKIKFWPYNTPYVGKILSGIELPGNQGVITNISTVKPEGIKVELSTNVQDSVPSYTELEPAVIKDINNPDTEAKLKISFLTDNAKLETALVDIISKIS